MVDSEIPSFACNPVRMVVTNIRGITAELPLTGGELTESQRMMNHVVETCGRLCTDGCVRDKSNRLDNIGLSLPPDPALEEMFDYVNRGLEAVAVDLLVRPQVQPKIRPVDLGATTGAHLKEVAERRLDVLREETVQTQLAGVINKQSGTAYGSKEIDELTTEYITPINDQAYDELVLLTKGNIRASLALISYMMVVYPLFRSGNPELQQKAEDIRIRGFIPANPYMIGARDIQRIGRMMSSEGVLTLPTSAYSATWLHITDNPEDYEHYTVEKGEIIDVFSGNLPAIQKRHLPVVIEAVAK